MIAVTGATGFLGSVLTRQLLEAGERVRALKRSSARIPDFLQNHGNLVWVEGDVCDPYALEELLEGAHQVYHTAALVSFNPADKKQLLHTNVNGTANVVNTCLEKPGIRLLHVSSVAALGEAKSGENINETAYLNISQTTSGYALSKHLSEFEVWRGMAEGLDAVIVNPSIIIGKECGLKGSGALFSTVKKGLTHYPSGSCGLVSVHDVAACMMALMASEIRGERYIINAENWLYKDLFDEIAQQLGVTAPQKRVKNWQLLWIAQLSEWKATLSKKAWGLSKDTARSALKKSSYSNQKISDALHIQFKPIAEEISDICRSIQ